MTRRLSPVPPPPEERRGPRTFEEIVSAIYNDRRVDLKQRELLLAVAYALYVAPPGDETSPLREARRVLGRQYGMNRYDDLIKADLPRYEPPQAVNQHTSSSPCEAPRPRAYTPRTKPTPLRKPPQPIVHISPGCTPPRDWRTEDGVCGANAHHLVMEKDPRTGWVTPHFFCKRHTDHAERVKEQVRTQNEAAPEPIPNRGGLLPCYFKADWEKVYRHYAPRWEPPSYGLCADEWPVPGRDPAPQRARIRLIVGGADLELTDGDNP